jgi:integrase
VGRKIGRRQRDRLTDREVKLAKAPGYIPDGAGLYLQVSEALTKSWIFRYTRNGRSREMGLGPYPAITLGRARQKRDECHQLLAEGLDPLEQRRAQERAAQTATARAVTFKVDAEAYIEAQRPTWKNAKHADQWTNTLATYAYPFIGKLLSSEIDTEHVLAVLQPIWHTKTETANRVRGRIESVLDFAKSKNHRTGENPARWKGHLDNLLAAPTKITKVVNHAALPYTQIGEFMHELRAEQGIAARAVEFVILTVARTNEAFNAEWSEIDLDAGLWSVPPARMKSGREHRVPLSAPAIKLLTELRKLGGAYVFPGAKEGKPLSNMAGLMLLERMGYDVTVHGFRSSFRDWAAEQTNYPREIAEAALAHVLKDKTEAAYQRGDLLPKRAKLMAAWAGYCAKLPSPATVTAIGTSRAQRTGQ